MSLRRHAAHMRVPSLCARAHAPTAPPHTRHPHTSERASEPRGRTNLHHHHALSTKYLSIIYALLPPRRLAPDAGRRAAGAGGLRPCPAAPLASHCLSLARPIAHPRAPFRFFSLSLSAPRSPAHLLALLTCTCTARSALPPVRLPSPGSRRASLTQPTHTQVNPAQSPLNLLRAPPPSFSFLLVNQITCLMCMPGGQWTNGGWWTGGRVELAAIGATLSTARYL